MDDSVMIAMSGGVDSAIAATLASKGRNSAGVTMRLTLPCANTAKAAEADIAGAAFVCEKMGIPHFVAELGELFQKQVVNLFINAYLNAQTPNPCVDCNKHIKFGALMDFATEKGYGKLATGHYARIEKSNNRYLLKRAADYSKDQSYMLYTLSQAQLSHAEFPLGELTKEHVRELAREIALPMAEKKDSQDICFVPDGDYAGFIERNINRELPKGNFVDLNGRILGEHSGIIHYTVGQRKGLGIALGAPAFVVSKSAADNTVVLADNDALFSSRVVAKEINFIPFDSLNGTLRCKAKLRYRQEAAPVTVTQTGEDEITVEFDTPQRAVSPGQSLVLYEDDYILGGGKIQ